MLAVRNFQMQNSAENLHYVFDIGDDPAAMDKDMFADI